MNNSPKKCFTIDLFLFAHYIFVMIVMTYDIDWNTDIPFIGFWILSLKCSWHFQRRHSHSFNTVSLILASTIETIACHDESVFLLSHVTNYCKLSCCLISCDLISHHNFAHNNLRGFLVIKEKLSSEALQENSLEYI